MSLYKLLALHGLLWSLIPTVLFTAPPLDVVELVNLHNTGAIANYKHPNGPGLILDALTALGYSIKALYWISQACVVLTILIVYWVALDWFDRDHDRARVASLTLLGVFYFILPTPEFNHNVLQMPLWAAVIALSWRAVSGDRWVSWLGLGACCGVLMWVKYSAAVLLVVQLCWFVFAPVARARLRGPGPWLAGLLAVLVASPQFAYLIGSDFLPIEYASARASKASGSVLEFMGAQMVNHLPAILLLALAGLVGRGMLGVKDAASRDVKTFVVFMGLGPLVLLSLVALVMGTGLRDMWGAPMFSLSGVVFVLWVGGRINATRTRRLSWLVSGFSAVLASIYTWQFFERDQRTAKPSRMHYPQVQIAEVARAHFQQTTGLNKPALIVAPYWEAGLIALQADGWITTMIEGDPAKSEHSGWQNLREGYLVAWSGELTTEMQDFLIRMDMSAQQAVTYHFNWSDEPGARMIDFSMIAIGPQL